ncbi:transporter [Rhizobium sp. CNPSo 4062]|uniref:transporter n=1 Tax=Rhizobium sp. CNPSo 4062 TaxID=3021410 RepID=UPI0025510F25|nr:transporter [Rhizobium sp. CNPSo 4062]MDK4700916.1 transporter [Rhizobium sp. CNPSo 4062]
MNRTIFLLALVSATPVLAEDDVDELARKVSNPASFMVSVPVHSDFDIGRWGDGKTYSATLDIEPVIPFALTDDWNMISHTDIPIAYSDPVGSAGGRLGIGDISQNLSFTPAHHGPLVWAFGPEFSLPTATNDRFGTGKLSIGPSGLLLLQTKSMSIGLSADHLWSVAGAGGRTRVNTTEIQPFLAWHIGQGRTISTNIDFSYDWVAHDYTLPISLSFSKIMKFGEQTVSVSFGAKYWLEGPKDGPQWGLKAGLVFLFPQKTSGS